MRKIFFTLLLIIIGLVTFTSCDTNISEEDKLYSVTFEENGGLEVEDITNIEKGSTITLPTIERTGYVFQGWYTSKRFIDGTEITNSTEIAKDIKVYAKWEALEYIVTINLNGGSMDSEYQNGTNKVNYGTVITLPDAKREGYLFQGFYENGNKTNEIIVTENKTVEAKWIDIATLQKEYQINLEPNGGIFYLYNTKEALVEEFLNDYSEFIGREVNTTNFWDYSYNNFIGEYGFLGNSIYFDKWHFLLEYLSTTAVQDKQEYIKMVADRKTLTRDESNICRSVVRNEILAFFLSTERVIPGWDGMFSANYARQELQTGYLEYCKTTAQTSYETGVGITLKSPVKEGYIFLGWYDNVECTGNSYSVIGENDYGDKTFYALWSKI